MSKRPKGRDVPPSTMRDLSWWGPRLSIKPHDWQVTFTNEAVIARCRACPAELRIEVGETADQFILVPIVVNAGEGIYRDDIDFVCDRLADEVQKRTRR